MSECVCVCVGGGVRGGRVKVVLFLDLFCSAFLFVLYNRLFVVSLYLTVRQTDRQTDNNVTVV